MLLPMSCGALYQPSAVGCCPSQTCDSGQTTSGPGAIALHVKESLQCCMTRCGAHTSELYPRWLKDHLISAHAANSTTLTHCKPEAVNTNLSHSYTSAQRACGLSGASKCYSHNLQQQQHRQLPQQDPRPGASCAVTWLQVPSKVICHCICLVWGAADATPLG